MAWILGFGGSKHDWSTCLVGTDGQIVAIDEERVTHKKYGIGSDLMLAASRKYVLASQGLSLKDIDYVIACDLVPLAFYFPLRHRTLRINHHLAHAYSAFIPSPFEKSAILVVDNAGSILHQDELGRNIVETISYGVGKGTDVSIFQRVKGIDLELRNHEFCTTNSLGYLYRIVSIHLGLYYQAKGGGQFSEDGKTMGLASYGSDRFVGELMQFISLEAEGEVRIVADSGEIDAFLSRVLREREQSFETKADLAFAVQAVLEEGLLHCARYLRRKTGLNSLVLAGGVALNCVANRRILNEAGFEHVFIQPAAGDNGVALGCAYYGQFAVAKERSNRVPITHNYLGNPYSEEAVLQALTDAADFVEWNAPECLAEEAASRIANGDVLALFRGGAEFGPRSLGNRSLLADPRSHTMRDHLNATVKKREWFRPFAPVVLASKVQDYFDFEGASPYMLLVAKVKQPDLLPAITHVDGTARIQTIREQDNPFYFKLVQAFEALTDVPVLLNTSFNSAGEPIVESPSDAVRAFLNMDIQVLVLERFVVTKKVGITERGN